MEFLDKINNIKGATILKLIGLVIMVMIVGGFLIQLLGAGLFFNIADRGSKMMNDSVASIGGSSPQIAYEAADMELSTRNVIPEPGHTTGDTAEDFEVTEYYANIETRNLQSTCAAVAQLKAKEYVIFENANEYDRGCSYTFKVGNANKEEILGVIEGLDPKDLTENVRTIKNRVDDYTSELEILTKKKQTIESTLNDAINSYDEIARVATRANDAQSLATIIDSKVRIIEKLSQERININAQIDRINRSKSEQLDRLEYTFFSVTISENKYIDMERIKDSWKLATKKFVNNVNEVLQNISVNLAAVLFFILQFVIYFIIILFLAKGLWKLAKKIWKGGNNS